MLIPVATPAGNRPVARLRTVCRNRGPSATADRLQELEAWLADDLEGLRSEMARVPLERSIAGLSARHQLRLGGKMLRPLCVLLAARLGSGFDTTARHLAVAVELIHNATLLHDDVIDVATSRRGAPAAPVIYGNAASVLAGDWLLVQALRRIRLCDDPSLLDAALETLERMIAAEALELENRGRTDLRHDEYFRVVDGKTAALFRYAMRAGSTAGRLPADQRTALEAFGEHLGVAFQLVDDALDLDGDPHVMGKATLSDLREGKTTYPLLVAAQRDHTLRRDLEDHLGRLEAGAPPAAFCRRLQRTLHSTGAVAECRDLARRRAADAVDALDALGPLPAGQSLEALALMATMAVERER